LLAGEIRAKLASAGTPIGSYDLQIAAITLAQNLTLVTHNTLTQMGQSPNSRSYNKAAKRLPFFRKRLILEVRILYFRSIYFILFAILSHGYHSKEPEQRLQELVAVKSNK
jgi:hypothetical protein